MTGFNEIVNSILILAMAMGIGFAAVKTNYISFEVKDALSKIIAKITLPILLCTSLTRVTLDGDRIKNSVIILFSGIIIVGILYTIGILISKIGKMNQPKAVVYQCMSACGNVVFLAYPLIEAIYGAEGILYAAIFAFANDIYVWTISVYRLSSMKNGCHTSRLSNLKNLINPATIAFFVSFVMMLFRWKFTGIFGTVLNGIGGTTTYLSMLFIGGTLAQVDFKKIFHHFELFLLVLVKMIIAPVLLTLILPLFHMDPMVMRIIILQVAMPAQTILIVLTTEYNGDTLFAAEGVFISTIAAMLTLPAVYWFSGICF